MSSNLKVNSLVPATGTEIGIGTTGGSIDFRCPATFGGNVTIGGTLTYDEVINIDSIGIVTARSGLNVQAGQLDVGSNIKLGNAGVVTATSFSGSGANLTGLTASQIPTLNQNTTGTAGGLTGTPNISVGTIAGSTGTFTGIATALRLDVKNGSQESHFAVNQIQFNPTGHAYIDNATNNKDIYFRLSRSSAMDTTMMQFDSDGEIIKFHKMISIGLQGGGDTATLGGGSGVGAQLTLKYADGTFNTRLLGNGNSYLNVFHGNLGIGTQSPLQKLHVKQGSTTTPAMIEALGAKSHIKFQHNGGPNYTTTIGSKSLGAGNVGLTFDTGYNGAVQRMTIDVNGKVLIGSDIHNDTLASGVGSQLQIEGNSYQTSSLALINNSTSTDPPFLNFGKSRAGTAGGTTIVQNNDRVGGIRWSVADGTDLHSRVAQIDVFVDGTPGSNDTPGMISIQTTPDGSSIPVDRVNIDSAGRVTLGAGIQSQFASQFNAGANQLLITNNGDTGLTIDSTSGTSSSIHFADGSTGSESYRGIIEYKHSEDDMRFAVEATHVARLRKGSYSDSGGGMIIGNNDDNSDDAHSDSRTLILGATGRSETGMTLLTSTSGTGKIRFSDGVQYYNQGAIGYYHNNRTVAQIPTYGESLSFVAAQKENNFVLNGNEAIRVCSDMDRQKMVDGFWKKAIDTTFSTVFTIRSGYDNSSIHRSYFYEIIVFGGDWGSHSANRTYFKGFINGADTYQGHTVIEHSGTYGSNSGGGGHYGSSQCTIQVTFTGNGNSHIQMKLSTGSVTAEGYARFIGFIRDYDGFHIR